MKIFDQKATVKHPVFQAVKMVEQTGKTISLLPKLSVLGRESYDMRGIKEKLSDELVDVVITTFTRAKVCGVDLWKTAGRKLDAEIETWEKSENSCQ